MSLGSFQFQNEFGKRIKHRFFLKHVGVAGIVDIGIYIIYTDLIFMRDQSYELSELIVNSLLTPDWLRNWTPTINRNVKSSCPAAQ